MGEIGRNDPCPCGSGRKYKHCCLGGGKVVDIAEPREASRPWRRMREAEGRLMPRMLEQGVKTWRQRGMDEAYERFFTDTPVPGDILTHREHESLFLTWFAFQFAPEPRGRQSAFPPTPAGMLLKEARDLTEFERRFLLETEGRPCRFHVVVAVEPGEWIDLEDALTGQTCRVVERTASRSVRRGGLIYARVVTLDGESIMVGCGAAQLKPTERTRLADAIRVNAGRRGRLTDADVEQLDDELRRWYLFAAEHELNPPLPTIANTDGDPLAPTTMHFELRCSPDEAFAALRPLNVTERDEAVLLQSAERDHSGLTAFTLDWTKRGNRQHKEWDNTILGQLNVRGTTLTASVNSNRRAERLRAEIEKRLRGRVAFVRSVIDSIETRMRESREKAWSGRAAARSAPVDDAEPTIDPAVLESFVQRHWDNWLDERIPALKNQTPRQAARTPSGRKRLEALLAEFEWRGGAPIERLRKELGL